MTVTKKIYKVHWSKFCRNWILWLLGIPINVLPVFLKQIDHVTSKDFQGQFNLASMILADFDFSFICISVLFILCIEGYFLEAEVPRLFRGYRVVPFSVLCGRLVLYCVFYFKPTLLPMIQENAQTAYNGATMVLTIVLGFVSNVGNAMEAIKESETT